MRKKRSEVIDWMVGLRIFLSLAIVICIGCGGSSSEKSPTNSTQPDVSVSPDNYSTLSASRLIQVRFSESMDTTTLALSGPLSGESDGGIWSESSQPNDTLVISPSSKWANGTFRSLTIDVDTVTGGAMDTLNLNYDVDAIIPTCNTSPMSGSYISGSEQITINFSESMDITSLNLNGVLAGESDAGFWSSPSLLTISPATLWSEGDGRSLTIDCNDAFGNAMAAHSLSYYIDNTLPSATAPENGTLIGPLETITIQFSEDLNPSSVALTVSNAPYTATWSSTYNEVVISPDTQWTYDAPLDITAYGVDFVHQVVSISRTYPVMPKDPAVGILVSTAAGDDGDGCGTTRQQPCQSINYGISRADATGRSDIWIQAGSYAEIVRIVDYPKNLMGGFDLSWHYAQSSTTDHLVSVIGFLDTDNRYKTLTLLSVTGPAEISTLRIEGPNASLPGESSYSIYINNSSEINFADLQIIAGNGADGSDGSDGIDADQFSAPDGIDGFDADSYIAACDDMSYSEGGGGGTYFSGTTDLSGGDGGTGGRMDQSCPSDEDATPGAGGQASANGGGGTGGSLCSQGGNGTAGNHGSDGSHGIGGLNTGTVIQDFWSGHSGTDGELGGNGGGGGGGGGSGGCDLGTASAIGAGGGGGGAGGARAPSAGTGGSAGGSSFAVFAANSTISSFNVEYYLGNGGNGGDGGDGGLGQPGGSGGTGGQAAGETGPGGDGGDGGSGGDSGSGGGGAGGNAYGIYLYNSTMINSTGSFFSGGSGGTGGLSYNGGQAGIVSDTN